MSAIEMLPRADVAEENKWNRESVFPTVEAWENALDATLADLPKVAAYEGKLHENAATLADALALQEDIMRRVMQTYMYAFMEYSMDTGNAVAGARAAKVQGYVGKITSTIAFIRPEMLEIGRETLDNWVASEPRLAHYAKEVDDIFRQAEHTRNAEIESILGMLETPFGMLENTVTTLTDAELPFGEAVGKDGTRHQISASTVETLLHQHDREARHSAWESFADTFLEFKGTLSNAYVTYVQQEDFMAKVRGYDSTIAASLSEYNIDRAVYDNLIDTFRQNLPTWHRYWNVRKKALKVDTLHPYDIWAPLTQDSVHVDYDQSMAWISAGLAPLGDDYVSVMKKGVLEQRWVDRFPNKGKRSGAFSFGVPGTHPFIMMNYDNTLSAMSTLAHELGHSMHSYLSWQNQPFVYSRYSMFLAEIASNFNQAMVRDYLFKTNADPLFQIQVIEEAMDNIHRYFFIMPSLARFELEVHTRVQTGDIPSPDELISILTGFYAEGFGDAVHIDHDRVGITWAQFGHLYNNFYVFQYATGISAAHHFARKIINGEDGAVEKYLGFLKAGNSQYSLDTLLEAGADMRSPAVVKAGFDTLSEYVDRLEQLVDENL